MNRLCYFVRLFLYEIFRKKYKQVLLKLHEEKAAMFARRLIQSARDMYETSEVSVGVQYSYGKLKNFRKYQDQMT